MIRFPVGFSFLPASLQPKQASRIPVSSLFHLWNFAQNTDQLFDKIGLSQPTSHTGAVAVSHLKRDPSCGKRPFSLGSVLTKLQHSSQSSLEHILVRLRLRIDRGTRRSLSLRCQTVPRLYEAAPDSFPAASSGSSKHLPDGADFWRTPSEWAGSCTKSRTVHYQWVSFNLFSVL